MTSTLWLPLSFWSVALVVSALYGYFAFDIHVWPRKYQDGADSTKDLKRACLVHQWWFNFIGSLTGWYALGTLLPSAICCLRGCCSPSSLSWGTGATAVVSLLGITGHLPLALFSLAAYGMDAVRKRMGS